MEYGFGYVIIRFLDTPYSIYLRGTTGVRVCSGFRVAVVRGRVSRSARGLRAAGETSNGKERSRV